jgi:methylthioribose-1-phosphate isomerase
MMDDHIRFSDQDNALLLLDQRHLPLRDEWYVCKGLEDTIHALQTMVIRGAPAIGVTAAYGCYLCVRETMDETGADGDWNDVLDDKLAKLKQARPTAVNLRWAVDIMDGIWKEHPGISLAALGTLFLTKAKAMHEEDIEINKRMGDYGASLLDDGDTVMTHCNAGALATAGWGTAIGVVYSGVKNGLNLKVIANETRPFLQGARLSAYELQKSNVDVTVATDNMCALLMQKGMVNKVVVGADRIAANGDVANKIGTFGVAIMARHFGIPFYVAAPTSTFDLQCERGELIPIEERTPYEVTHPTGESQIVPDDVPVHTFAFDVTPNELVTAIITEKGILKPPFAEAIQKKIAPKSRGAFG